MAQSVGRRIGNMLSPVMGHCDPDAMISTRSTDPIRASGRRPLLKAGHMTACDLLRQDVRIPLPTRGHPHMTGGTDPPYMSTVPARKALMVSPAPPKGIARIFTPRAEKISSPDRWTPPPAPSVP
jgi:hypothetical protein